MGITGLLQVLKPNLKQKSLRQYSNKRIAIDGYAWLHKAAYSCSRDLCEHRPTNMLSKFCVSNAKLLQSHGITPIFVFDGASLPSKKNTEISRKEKRDEHLQKARELSKNNLRNFGSDSKNETKISAFSSHNTPQITTFKDIKNEYDQAVEITPWLASAAIKSLNEIGIETIVAPYEADPQLAYLCQIGYVDAVMCEDGDLVVYGCPKILFKFDKQNETVLEYNKDDLEYSPFRGFNRNQLVYSCIFAGCDYCKNISRVGIKTAIKAMTKYNQNNGDNGMMDLNECLSEFIQQHGNVLGSVEEKKEYMKKVRNAVLTFNYAYVFDPVNRKVVNLHEIDANENEPLSSLLHSQITSVDNSHEVTSEEEMKSKLRKKSDELLKYSKEMKDESNEINGLEDIIGTKIDDHVMEEIISGNMNPETHEYFNETIDMDLYEKSIYHDNSSRKSVISTNSTTSMKSKYSHNSLNFSTKQSSIFNPLNNLNNVNDNSYNEESNYVILPKHLRQSMKTKEYHVEIIELFDLDDIQYEDKDKSDKKGRRSLIQKYNINVDEDLIELDEDKTQMKQFVEPKKVTQRKRRGMKQNVKMTNLQIRTGIDSKEREEIDRKMFEESEKLFESKRIMKDVAYVSNNFKVSLPWFDIIDVIQGLN